MTHTSSMATPEAGALVDDGGSAFPHPELREDGDRYLASLGMSLLDWFAGQALSGILTAQVNGGQIFDVSSNKDIAQNCYELAAALLAVRRANR